MLTPSFTSLPGPPLTEKNTVATLLEHGVIVGIGVPEAWEARNARFDAGWVYIRCHFVNSKVGSSFWIV